METGAAHLPRLQPARWVRRVLRTSRPLRAPPAEQNPRLAKTVAFLPGSRSVQLLTVKLARRWREKELDLAQGHLATQTARVWPLTPLRREWARCPIPRFRRSLKIRPRMWIIGFSGIGSFTP